jgi:hypothetical protein
LSQAIQNFHGLESEGGVSLLGEKYVLKIGIKFAGSGDTSAQDSWLGVSGSNNNSTFTSSK